MSHFQEFIMITALIFFTIILQMMRNDQVIFKEIGEMTGTISYVHLILPMDIPGLKEWADHYIQQVRDLKKATLDQKFQLKGNEYYKLQYTEDIWASYEEACSQHIRMIKRLEEDFQFPESQNVFLWYLLDLTQVLPHASQHQAPVDFQIRIQDKQFVGGLIQGLLVTAIGLYNTHTLN